MFSPDTITFTDIIDTVTKAHGVLARTDEINALSNGSDDVRYRTLTQQMAVVLEFLAAQAEPTVEAPALDAITAATDALDYLA